MHTTPAGERPPWKVPLTWAQTARLRATAASLDARAAAKRLRAELAWIHRCMATDLPVSEANYAIAWHLAQSVWTNIGEARKLRALAEQYEREEGR